MYEDIVMGIAKEAIYVVLLISAPILGGSLLIGLLVSILQATTQIQEQTLTYVPKIVVIFIILIIFGPWMLNILTGFTNNLFAGIPQYITYR